MFFKLDIFCRFFENGWEFLKNGWGSIGFNNPEIHGNGWGGRIRTHECRDQNPVPYRLATPQQSLLSSRLRSFKNTTTSLLCGLVLMIFSFLPSNANTSYPKYQSELLTSKVRPVEQARWFREGLLYSNSGQLYFNNEPIKLLKSNTNELGLVINDIYVDGKDFYLATDMGVFKNYRRIFSKAACQQVIKSRSNIFIACRQGIYQAAIERSGFQANFDWQLDELSPQDANFMLLNRSGKKVKYASAVNGFYYHGTKGKWFNRSYGLDRDFNDSFGFGRFTETGAVIYLASSSGVYQSSNQGKSWIKANSGLKANADGFYTIRSIETNQQQILAITSRGLYQASPGNPLEWQEINVADSQKSKDYQNDFYSLQSQAGKLLISNSQGQIFSLKAEQSQTAKQPRAKANFIKIISAEPKIQDLHQVALEFAGIPTGRDFGKYKRQARWRNLIPDFEAFAERDTEDILAIETEAEDSFSSASSNLNSGLGITNLDRNDDQINAGIRFKWQLSNLVYDPEITDINTSARITANIRENILTELTQIYYQRKELVYKLLSASDYKFSEKMKLEQYTAQLDARTGAWFSAKLMKQINKLITDLPLLEKQRVLEIYT